MDILIGATDLYDYSKIKIWSESIRQSNFDGDVVLLAYRLVNEPEIIYNCKKLKIDIIKCEYNNRGMPIVHNQMNRDTVCHQMRLFHAWQYLKQAEGIYENVIFTDVKDICFQSNPSEWLSQNAGFDIIAPSEGITYGNEPWNTENMINGYGPYIAQAASEYIVYNVGTIAGISKCMQELCLLLYTMGEGRYIPNDQSSFGLVANSPMFPRIRRTPMNDGWACQCSTMFEPKNKHLEPFLLESKPIIRDGQVYTNDNKLCCLLHQYDRVDVLRAAIEERYK